MGCATSNTATTNPTMTNNGRDNKMEYNHRFMVEIAGMDGKDLRMMVERREIIHYKVVDLKSDIPPEHMDFMARLQNPLSDMTVKNNSNEVKSITATGANDYKENISIATNQQGENNE